MCGIAGIFSWGGMLAPDEAAVRRMCACISHRGPDGEGVLIVRGRDSSCGMGHRRLAILDPEPRANQPFTAEHHGRRVHLTYNGEIYNFREVRARLERELPGYGWRTTGDTEVVLAAYIAWGEACVDALVGMFALAIFDEVSGDLFLARDPMGQKPLLLGRPRAADHTLAFASEMSALMSVPWVDRTVSDMALGQYLAHGYVPSPGSIYAGVTKLMPGTTLTISKSGERRQPHLL